MRKQGEEMRGGVRKMYTAIMVISIQGWIIAVESERSFESLVQCNQYIAESLSSLSNDFVEYTKFGVKDMRCRLSKTVERKNER